MFTEQDFLNAIAAVEAAEYIVCGSTEQPHLLNPADKQRGKGICHNCGRMILTTS